MYVFQPNGERAASLSYMYGVASSDCVQWPTGIGIGDDGFVFVCDGIGNTAFTVLVVLNIYECNNILLYKTIQGMMHQFCHNNRV